MCSYYACIYIKTIRRIANYHTAKRQTIHDIHDHVIVTDPEVPGLPKLQELAVVEV